MGVLANVLRSPLPDFDGAACRGMDIDLFIASEDDRTQYRSEDAKAVCRSCPCMEACREYAIADPRLIGVWGRDDGEGPGSDPLPQTDGGVERCLSMWS